MGEEHSSQLRGLPGGSVKLDVDITRTMPTKSVLFLGSTCNLVLHSGGSGGILYNEKGLVDLGKNQHRVTKQQRDWLQTFCVVCTQCSQICEFFFFPVLTIVLYHFCTGLFFLCRDGHIWEWTEL